MQVVCESDTRQRPVIKGTTIIILLCFGIVGALCSILRGSLANTPPLQRAALLKLNILTKCHQDNLTVCQTKKNDLFYSNSCMNINLSTPNFIFENYRILPPYDFQNGTSYYYSSTFQSLILVSFILTVLLFTIMSCILLSIRIIKNDSYNSTHTLY